MLLVKAHGGNVITVWDLGEVKPASFHLATFFISVTSVDLHDGCPPDQITLLSLFSMLNNNK